MKKMNRRSGLSLLEVVIAAALLGLIAALMYGFMSSATNQYSSDQTRETLYQSARRILDEVANELRDANPDAVFVTASPVSIQFQRAKQWNTSTNEMEWSNDITYTLTASTIDANSNRIFSDDWGIQRSGPSNPQATVSETKMVCHYVKANGFTITYDPASKRVALSLTLTSSKPGESAMEITATTSVVIRSNNI